MFMQEQTSDNLCPFRFPATREVSVALLWIAANYCGVISIHVVWLLFRNTYLNCHCVILHVSH